MTGLSGKTVLVTRSEQGSEGVKAMFESRGARVLVLPTIEFADPDSWDGCDTAISNIRKYDAVLFTSKNAVERFLRRIDSVNREARKVLSRQKIYAIGEKTEAALETEGLPVTPAPDFSSAEELAGALGHESVAGKAFLFPKSNIARNILPNALRDLDAIVDEVVVYKNIAPHQRDLDSIRNALGAHKVDVVTFFSPSAVRNFVQMMGTNCLDHCLVAVIGPTTGQAAADVGVTVHVIATKPDAEVLADTVAEYLEQQ